MSRRTRETVLWAVVGLACVVAPVMTLTASGGPLRAAAGFVVLVLAPGVALLPLLTRGAVPQIGLVVAFSVGIAVLGAQAMLWLHVWDPGAATCVLSAVCLAVIVVHLRGRRNPGEALREALAVRPTTSGLVHAAVIAFALVNWGTAVVYADPAKLSGYGLLAVLEPTYLVALAALAIGFAAAAASDRASPAVLAAYVVALVVVIHATAPLVYDAPRYAWTYKHLGVIDAIAMHGAVDRSIDIYQNWPGAFAFVAWLADATGLAPESIARWAQPGFELAFVAAAVFALRGVTGNARAVWVAAWLMVAANWIGQDYLSPQALGFVLALAVIGVALGGRRGAAAMSPARALVAGGTCYLALVMTHQLSPVFVIGAVGALALLTRRPPAWVVAALVAIEAWWIWASRDFVFAHFDLLSFDQSTSARPVPSNDALPGVALGANASRAVIVLIGALAVAGFVRRRRAGLPVRVPAAMAVVPFVIAVFQSYDGEGPLRAYLFALPWLALLATEVCLPARRTWVLPAVSALILTGSLFGYFGQDLVSRMEPSDVAASRWFLDHAPRGAALWLVAPNYPDRVDRHYEAHLDGSKALTDEPGFSGHALGTADVSRIAATVGPGGFLVLTPSQERYAKFYGLLPAGTFPRLAQALEASPAFRLVYRRGDARVFEVVPR